LPELDKDFSAGHDHPMIASKMPRQLHEKSTVEEIRKRFDADVERFSNLESGQQAAMDAPLILDVVARSAACHVRPQGRLLDLGWAQATSRCAC